MTSPVSFFGVGANHPLLSAAVNLPLWASILPNQGALTPSFTRATLAKALDFEGREYTALSGEARFPGTRRVQNLLTATTTLSNQGVTTTAGAWTLSFSGTGSVALSGTVTDNLAGTGAANRVQKTVTATAGTLTLTVTGSVTSAQLENVTGQSVQTASEYVSVGVLAAPYQGTGVDGVQCFTTDYTGAPIADATIARYRAETVSTNYALWSRDLTNVAWVKVNCTAAATATGADGVANSASTLTATAGNATCLQTLVRGSVQRITGCSIKRRTGSGVVNMTQDAGVTWTPVTVTAAWTQVSIPATTAANPVLGFQIVTNADAVDIDHAQHEEAAFISSPIDTTTVAVQRNADVLTYTGAAIANYMTLAASFSRAVGVSSAGVPATLSDGTVSNYAETYITSATQISALGGVSGVTQWNQVMTNAYTPGTRSKIAFSMATNNILMDKDGTAQTPDVSATLPVVTQLNVGHVAGLASLQGNVGDIYLWTRNLSQSELAAVDR